MRSLCLAALIGLLSFSLAGPVAHATPAPPDSAAAWNLLWANQDVAARKALAAQAAANPSDIDALRGLALLDAIEDRPLSQIGHLASLYKAAPGSVFADAYWPEFDRACTITGQFGTLKTVAKAILASAAARPQLRADATCSLAAADEVAGDFAAASKLKDSLGFITAWKVIGPFNNTSRAGFDTAYAPETGIDFAAAAVGDNDRRVVWRNLTDIDIDRFALVGEELSQTAEQVVYAVTAVKSPAAQSAILSLDCEGAYKVFVDGQTVAAHALYGESTGHPLQSVEVPVNLAAGWNTVLVKCAVDTEDSSRFRLRLTTPAGQPLVCQASPAEAHGASVASTAAAETLDPKPFVAQELLSGPKSPGSLYLAGIMLQHTGDSDGRIAAAESALALAPKSGLLMQAVANDYTEAGRSDDAKAQMTLAAAADSRLIVSQVWQLRDKVKELTAAENISRLKNLLAVTPDSPNVWNALSDAYESASLTGQVHMAKEKLLTVENGPTAYDIDAELDSEAYVAKMLNRGLKLYPNATTLLDKRAAQLIASQDYAKAIAIYQKMLVWDPTNIGVLSELGGAYYNMGQKNSAVKYYRSELGFTPQSKSLLVQIADIDQEIGHKDAAIAGYRSAIALDPSDVSVRDKLDLATGTKRPIDLVPATPAAPILAHLPKLTDAHDASVIWSLDECRRAVYPDGATVDVFHTIVTVMDDEGVKMFGEMPLDKPSGTANADVQIARIIGPDGKIQDTSKHSDGDEVAFPSLKPGDTIELEYQVTDYQSGDLAGQFWSSWEFDSTRGPSRLCRYVLITPPSTQFNIANHGKIPDPVISTVGGWKVTEWKETDIPQTKYERNMIGGRDKHSWLDISSVKDWATVVKWYVGLSKSRCVPDPSVTQTALSLTKDCKTNDEKLHALIAYIRAIPYQSSPFRLSAFVPTEGKQVIREQYGDCKDKAALLTAMLAALGIRSHMVLLSPRDTGLTPFLPSPRFDHAIALVDTSTGPLFVDGTADKMAYGVLPFGDEQVPCLVIDPATTALTQTAGTPLDSEHSSETVNATIDETGRMSATASMTFQANAAWIFRSVLSSVESARIKAMLAKLVTYFAPSATFDSGTVTGLADIDAPLTLNVTYHVDHYAVKAGDVLILHAPILMPKGDNDDPEFNADHRVADMDIAAGRGTDHYHITVKVPDGYVPEELPASVTQTSDWGSFSYAYSFANGILTVDFDNIDSAYLVPAASVKSYLAAARKSDDQSQLQIVFRKK